MKGETNYLVLILAYIVIGVVAFLIFRWYDKLQSDLFDKDGYFGKYLVLRRGYYGSLPEAKDLSGGKEAKKRIRVYWLTMVPLGYVIGIFTIGTFPIYIILSLIFPSDS